MDNFMGYWIDMKDWKEIKYDKDSNYGGFYIPPGYTLKNYQFHIELYPEKDLLILEEKGKFYDDHAIIRFTVQTIAEANYIVNHAISVKTI